MNEVIAYYVPDYNYAAVFGVCLGMYLMINLDIVVRGAVTFIKGWRNVQ